MRRIAAFAPSPPSPRLALQRRLESRDVGGARRREVLCLAWVSGQVVELQGGAAVAAAGEGGSSGERESGQGETNSTCLRPRLRGCAGVRHAASPRAIGHTGHLIAPADEL